VSLNVIKRIRPDVVFSDVEMPEMAGLQRCTMAALRARLAQHWQS
jgi:YesN/AraC family two-component response regulator